MDHKDSRAPTIIDVAKQAGVSPMTVSRVINGKQAVREATRDKVQAAIDALGYAPSAAARAWPGARRSGSACCSPTLPPPSSPNC